MKNWCVIVSVMITLCANIAKTAPASNSSTFSFVILHTNDMHSHFEQWTEATECTKSQVNDASFYGGFARVSHVVKQNRAESSTGGLPVLFLNAGDNYIGTPFFTFFKHKIVSESMNLLKPDAMCVGNHEFTLGLQGLIPFLEHATFPVLLSNVNNSANHTLWKNKQLRNSVVVDVKGVKVGIIGYLTPDTHQYANLGGLQLIDEVEAINKEADKLDSEGVKIIIALGHSGYHIDQIIAKQCPLVDIIVGAHTHSFLYSGAESVTDPISGPYPTVIEQNSGKQVIIVQAYQYTKYIGKLNVIFDNDGNLINWNGQPIQLNESIPEDPEMLNVLEKYSAQINDLKNQMVGVSRVSLNVTKCQLNECNIGNMVTDAYVYSRAKQYNGPYWTDAPIGLVQSAGIRDSTCAGNITAFELNAIIPYNNSLVVVNVTGASLLQAFEHSVSEYPMGSNYFLQISGARVAYNITNRPGQRVKSLMVLCSDCDIPFYSEIEPNRKYGVILTSYLHQGSDNFGMFKNFEAEEMNLFMRDAVRQYIQDAGIIYPILERRTTFYDGDSICVACDTRTKPLYLR